MRQEFLEFIKKNMNEKEKEKIQKWLIGKGKTEISLEDVPDCFGFADDEIDDCQICILHRLCEECIVEILIPFILEEMRRVSPLYLNEVISEVRKLFNCRALKFSETEVMK